MSTLTRRRFFGLSAWAVGLGLGLPSAGARPFGANEKVVVGVMGCSRSNFGRNPGRGSTLAMGFAAQPGTEVKTVCDVDSEYLKAVVKDVAGKQSRAPAGVVDFRRILDDKDIDVLVIGAPDHWHAPAAILGCAAGKHVYVEKPCSHNGREGELLVAAARKHRRVVQHGTQRRSWKSHRRAIEAIREGAIGRVLYARCYHFGNRPTIGRGEPAVVPERLDWNLWQGPAPERAYRDNYVHYNWHWFWHWGTSELGNNGVHTVDIARWGLGADYPVQVSSVGSRLRFDDDQETPDTNLATFRFENGTSITWEGRSWGARTEADSKYQIVFHGERGTLGIAGSRFSIFDSSGEEVVNEGSNGGDALHIGNFLQAVRGAARPFAEIEEGHKSALLCHLGNISYRLGRSLRVDPKTGRPEDDPKADALWGRHYRPGWEPVI